MSLEGIVTLGGLIIDPNYTGKLIFCLYNLSSHNYLLQPGKKLVAGVFYRTDKESDKRPETINDFPYELIRIVVDSKPNSISTINNVLEELKTEIQTIKNQFTYDDQWKKEFQTGLTEIRHIIKEMGEKLGVEIETRQKETHDLGKEQAALMKAVIPIAEDQKKYQTIRGLFIATISAVLGALIFFVINRFFL